MTFRLRLSKCRELLIHARISPIPLPALLLTFALVIIGLIVSISTKFTLTTLPNMLPLVGLVLGVDVVSRLAPQTRIVESVQVFLYGLLYFVTTSLCAVFAAYSAQRLAFPLQDQNLASIDLALGFKWFDFVHWVDSHFVVQTIFHLAYDSILGQVFIPLIVLAFTNQIGELRTYILAFSIALTTTILISVLVPAAGPIVLVDRAAFKVLEFTGATPLDHLLRLREAGPLIMKDFPGGIATFPSFHATIALLTPLTLRKYRHLFVVLVILNAAMLGATVTEGAHYFIDVIAGSWMAIFAYLLAKRLIKATDRSFHHHLNPASRPYSSAQVPV
jgi:membrane-associated phospholipid phosphatase